MHDDEEFEGETSLDETAAEVTCPHCGEVIEITIDPGGGAHQEFVEDCEVCCRPWQVTVVVSADGGSEVSVEPA